MTLINRIRTWLGIEQIINNQSAISGQLGQLQRGLQQVSGKVDAITPGLGRIIAKLDPLYGRPEIDPARKEESDALGEATIAKLKAEARAREQTGGPR